MFTGVSYKSRGDSKAHSDSMEKPTSVWMTSHHSYITGAPRRALQGVSSSPDGIYCLYKPTEESRESCNVSVSIQSLFPSSRGETFQPEGDSYITQGALTGVELTSRHTDSRDSRKEVATDKIKPLKACLQGSHFN